jgi:FOG: Transposase and inactivated derivatives
METSGDVTHDELIVLNNGLVVRRVSAWVEVEGKQRKFTFLTNNRKWSAQTICELYKARWQIEVFFKQIKQTLKLSDFLGHSANAVRWQIWTALLVYVLLRFLSRMSSWSHSFTRVFAVVRAALWERIDLLGFLRMLCGTADGDFRNLARPDQAYFPGF